jgi:hypothetical protein
MWKQAVFVGAMSIAGCVPPATAVSSQGFQALRDAATTCKAQCESIGMTLGSVVIIANNTGCVCSAKSAPAAPTAEAAAGGMALLMLNQQPVQHEPLSTQHLDR